MIWSFRLQYDETCHCKFEDLPAQSGSPQQQLQELAAYFAEFALPSAPPARVLVFATSLVHFSPNLWNLHGKAHQNLKMHLTLLHKLHLVSCCVLYCIKNVVSLVVYRSNFWIVKTLNLIEPDRTPRPGSLRSPRGPWLHRWAPWCAHSNGAAEQRSHWGRSHQQLYLRNTDNKRPGIKSHRKPFENTFRFSSRSILGNFQMFCWRSSFLSGHVPVYIQKTLALFAKLCPQSLSPLSLFLVSCILGFVPSYHSLLFAIQTKENHLPKLTWVIRHFLQPKVA